MQYGFILPHGDIHTLVELAHEAEVAGWDGVFYWDGIYIKEAGPMYDPWIVLAAMALRTERVRLGLILTPPSRRRPWKLARETVTLDHLSQGRLILPVGLGALEDGGFIKVGEDTDRYDCLHILKVSIAIKFALFRLFIPLLLSHLHGWLARSAP